MPAPTPTRRQLILPLAAVASALAILFRFPPDRFHFYPQCPFHQYTGLLCPGCGATRALAALLHGRINEALHWNSLVIVLLPLLAVYALATYRRRAWLPLPPPATLTLCAIALAFTVIRNLA